MPKLPFIIDDSAWRTLAPDEELTQLGQNPDIEPEYANLLRVFRKADLRIEWNCGRTVVLNNIIVYLVLGFTAQLVILILTLNSDLRDAFIAFTSKH